MGITKQMIRTATPALQQKVFLGIAAMILACAGWAQEKTLESVSLDPEHEHDLLVLPDFEKASDSTFERDDFQIKIESENDKVKYEARELGTTDDPIVHWESISEEPVHLVFDTKNKRFQRLMNKVRVVLSNYSELETLIEETDAKSGKAYPKLGYAVLELPTEKHPASTVKVLEKRAEVQAAFVMVERPPEVPH